MIFIHPQHNTPCGYKGFVLVFRALIGTVDTSISLSMCHSARLARENSTCKPHRRDNSGTSMIASPRTCHANRLPFCPVHNSNTAPYPTTTQTAAPTSSFLRLPSSVGVSGSDSYVPTPPVIASGWPIGSSGSPLGGEWKVPFRLLLLHCRNTDCLVDPHRRQSIAYRAYQNVRKIRQPVIATTTHFRYLTHLEVTVKPPWGLMRQSVFTETKIHSRDSITFKKIYCLKQITCP